MIVHIINNIIVSGEGRASCVLKIAENLWTVGARPEPRWGSSQRSPDPLAGGEPYPHCRPLASIFGPTSSFFCPSEVRPRFSALRPRFLALRPFSALRPRFSALRPRFLALRPRFSALWSVPNASDQRVTTDQCVLLWISDERSTTQLSGSETNVLDSLKLQLDRSIARHLDKGLFRSPYTYTSLPCGQQLSYSAW